MNAVATAEVRLIGRTRRGAAVLLGLAALLLLAVAISLCMGKYPLRPGELARWLLQSTTGHGALADARMRLLHDLLVEVRLPRIVAACLVGAALAVAGAGFQAMFVNPLVSPSLLGVLAGASFGAALGIVACRTWPEVQVATLLGGLLAVALTVGIASAYRVGGTLVLVLAGIVVSTFFNALVWLVKYLADPQNQLPAIVYWLMGNMALADRTAVTRAALPILLGVGTLMAMGRQLDALSMGDEEARALGLNVRAVRAVVITAATLVSALTVVLAGVVGWVGLVVPHATRMVVGPGHRLLLPACALVGAVYVLAMDDLSRLAFAFEIPIGIVTALLGIPFFLAVLGNARKGWSG